RAQVAVGVELAARDEPVRAGAVGALDLLARDEGVVGAARLALDGLEARDALVEGGDRRLGVGGRRGARRAGRQRAVGLVAERGGLGGRVAQRRAAQRLGAQLALALGGAPVLLGGEVVGAQALERAALRERDHVVEVAGAQRVGVHALEVLEPDQRGAVHVAAREVARRLEAVGVVGHAAAQHRHHLEHAGGGLEARLGGGRGRAGAGGEGDRDRERGDAPDHFPIFIASAFSIFSVARTAAAIWSESTARVE